MNEAPERLGIVWSPQARTDLRRIDREIALQILHCVGEFLLKRSGDVKRLQPPLTGFRLRCGDYRVFFDPQDDSAILVTGVRNRREAYR